MGGYAETSLDEMWKDSGIKTMIAFFLGFYCFGYLGFRGKKFQMLGQYIAISNRIMKNLSVLPWVNEESKRIVARYLVACYAMYFAQVNPANDVSTRRGILQGLVSKGVLTDEEFTTIEYATGGTFMKAHNIGFTWMGSIVADFCKDRTSDVTFGFISELINAAEDRLDGNPPAGIPAVLVVIVNGAVVITCLLDSLACGIGMAEGIPNPDVGSEALFFMAFKLWLFVTFNTSILEFCRQIGNYVIGNDCMDADHHGLMAKLSGELQIYFKCNL